MAARIPIAHLHGGELTEGSFDDSIRHSITKMSHLHFVASEEYKNRVIQLGEQPSKIFNVGGLGIDNVFKLKLLSKEKLESNIGFKFLKKNLLITFHPVSLEPNVASVQIDELLKALSKLRETGLIFTMPNADIDYKIISKKIIDFCKKNLNAKYYISLGQLSYLSCIKYIDGVVGNSSSGLLEVPSFKKGTINIGDRQRGRLKAKSVIDCEPEANSITNALENLFSKEFKVLLEKVVNPYGKGGASKKIVDILEKQLFNIYFKKKFYDINLNN